MKKRDAQGILRRFPSWLRLLLKAVEKPCKEEKAEKTNGAKEEVFEQRVVVTSQMTNAETNVNHNDYNSLFSQTLEIYLLKHAQIDFFKKYELKVEKAFYKYRKDFYFGDNIIIKLYVAENGNSHRVYEGKFINEMTGKIHAYGWQKIKLTRL